MSENPYEVPDAAFDDGERAEVGQGLGRFGSDNGSELTIGPRRQFTVSWIGRNGALGIVCIAAWMVPVLAAVARGSVVARHNLALLVLAPACAPFAVMLVAPLLYAGFPALPRRRAAATPCELAFDPRLPGSPAELRDKADDLGFVWIEGDFLAYEGDRVSLRVHRKDVESIRNVWTINAFTGAWSPELAIELGVPLASRRSFRLVRRDRFRTPAAPFRNARLRREIRTWLAAGA